MNGPFEDERLDRALGQTLAARAASPGEHPDPEVLLEYHLHTFPPEDEEVIADHLARCAECAQLVLDYDRLGTPLLPAEQAPSRAELEQAWRRFGERRSLGKGSSGRLAQASPWALAASLLLSVGLFFWGNAAHQRLKESDRPEARVAHAYLDPQGQKAERAGEAPERIVLRPEIEQLSLSLGLASIPTADRYRMELRSGDGRLLWSDPKVPREESGLFGVVLPRRFLEPGQYTIRILEGAASGPAGQLVAEYRFEAVRAPAQR